MKRFGPDPRPFFDSAYHGTAPWDVGRPQPALVALLEKYPPTAPVLDVRCGSGDLAIYLAQAGLDVLGIDFSEAAIAQARQRAGALHLDTAASLALVVADALRVSLLDRQFGAVVDSGFLHGLVRGDRDRFVAELASVLLPGGRYSVLGFASKRLWPPTRPGISEKELRRHFTPEIGWHIHEIVSAGFHTVKSPTAAIRACIERVPAPRA
ncbi:MAG TPA: class I SAM-dependent methyltransferase [Longimicrobiaceae bacterium]|nr:class I SAM-dependent methyltransferase [Longimicrobiaceae bacterium]